MSWLRGSSQRYWPGGAAAQRKSDTPLVFSASSADKKVFFATLRGSIGLAYHNIHARNIPNRHAALPFLRNFERPPKNVSRVPARNRFKAANSRS